MSKLSSSDLLIHRMKGDHSWEVIDRTIDVIGGVYQSRKCKICGEIKTDKVSESDIWTSYSGPLGTTFSGSVYSVGTTSMGGGSGLGRFSNVPLTVSGTSGSNTLHVSSTGGAGRSVVFNNIKTTYS